MMIIDSKLPYPSGTATGVLINGFHTPKGNVMAKYDYEINYVYVICTLYLLFQDENI